MDWVLEKLSLVVDIKVLTVSNKGALNQFILLQTTPKSPADTTPDTPMEKSIGKAPDTPIDNTPGAPLGFQTYDFSVLKVTVFGDSHDFSYLERRKPEGRAPR